MDYSRKSTTKEISDRFDRDVERFSNLTTGQVSTIDADISLELIADAASALVPGATRVLDIGCGAGNYTLKMLSKVPKLECTLVDLSLPMLQKAKERISETSCTKIELHHGDIRDVELPANYFDLILAGAVLHHLRETSEWEFVFNKIFNLLKPGACLLISDLITHDTAIINHLMWQKYGEYLEKIGGQDYRKKVLDYIDKEDSPRSLNFQLELMKKIGFSKIEVLHKNLCFATFLGIK